MTLSEQQRKFTRMVANLIIFTYESGYELTFGEAYRTPEQAKLNEKKGTGVANSFHCKRLAVDLQLFKDGKYLTDTPSYKFMGDYWKLQGGTWGGDFKKADGNHFSLGE